MAGDVDHLSAGDTLAHAMTAPANRRSRRMSEQVLVCGCDLQSLRALRLVLRGAGFGVAATDNAVDALDRVAVCLPQGAIVELDLAGGDGVELCRRLREWSTMPLIVLSAQDDEEEAVLALEAGADHYVTKPFRPGELVARLRAVLRRVEGADDCARVHVGGLEIDLAARMVFREGERIHLTPIEYRVLRVLTRHRGRVLTHDELRREVWGGDSGGRAAGCARGTTSPASYRPTTSLARSCACSLIVAPSCAVLELREQARALNAADHRAASALNNASVSRAESRRA